MRTAELFAWIKERHAISLLHEAGASKPYTQDPILQKFSFCNVYRERDRVTRWVAKNWRDKNKKDPHLWFAMVVARFINWPDTMQQLGYPLETMAVGTASLAFNYFAGAFLGVVESRQAAGQQVYGGAYTISTNGRTMVKHRYLLEHVFRPLWANREAVESVLANRRVSLQGVHTALTAFQGLGSFMAAQVIADLKYAQLRKAPDWWTWAASGPGSRRGLNRVCHGTATGHTDKLLAPWREDVWLQTLQILHDEISGMAAAAELPQIHAQDLQNCLCEWDKWCRVTNNEGRPRSLYPGHA